MKNKIIFLDIDGVLNVYGEGVDKFGPTFHKHLEENLRTIIEKTGADIVISSTWRFDGIERMQNMWLYRNLPGKIVGITPDCAIVVSKGIEEFYDKVERGHEIQLYINENNVDSYCIIDDDSDMLNSQLPFFVKTSGNISHSDYVDIGYGLTKECALQAIKILNND